MGRLRAVKRPPASGTIIFYGRSIATSNSTTKVQSSTPSDLDSTPSTPDNACARSLNSLDSTSSASSLGNEKEKESDRIKALQPQAFANTGSVHSDDSFWPIVQSSPANPDYALEKGKNPACHVILRLVKDISTVFQEVPYVKIVAGLVQQIVTISDVSSSLVIIRCPSI